MIALVIPAHNPAPSLPDIIRSVRSRFPLVVVVNDGSSERYTQVFHACEREGATIVTHARNTGMGGALKTGFRRAMRYSGITGIVAADADGQHLAADIATVASVLVQHPECVVLGTRSLQEAPFHRRWGNAILNALFFAIAGKAVSDTQTGLRGWPVSVVKRLCDLPYNGFDFQTACLLSIDHERIWQVPIETVYPEGTERSHVRLWDFFRIIGVMLAQTLRNRGLARHGAAGWNAGSV